MTRTRWRALAALLVMAAPLAACGDGTDAADTTTTAPSEPSPEDTTTTTIVAAPPGHSWDFKFVTEDGWEYDAVIDLTYEAEFFEDITESPPGFARFGSDIVGSFTVQIDDSLEGRTAPSTAVDEIRALYVLPEGSLTTGPDDAGVVPAELESENDSCFVSPEVSMGDEPDQFVLKCNVETLRSIAGQDSSEAALQQLLGVLDEYTVESFDLLIAGEATQGCQVILPIGSAPKGASFESVAGERITKCEVTEGTYSAT